MQALSNEQIQQNRMKFILLCENNIKREGISLLLNHLRHTDFFIAPCSTKYHLNFRGGLCQHSLNVYEVLLDLCKMFKVDIEKNLETLTIVALFHDYCKADFYKLESKFVRKGNQWVTEQVYVCDDQNPLGHGEKSLYLLSKFIDLTNEEACAIRWHMGAFDNAFRGGEQAYNNASTMYELVSLLHAADLLSTRCLEK